MEQSMSSQEEKSQKKRILIVEDDSDIREHLVLAFEKVDFQVDSAGDADTAIVRIKNEPYDCIMMDIQLPGQSGLHLAAMARSSKKNGKTPIYICSGNVDQRSKALAEKLKVFDVIEKPFDCFEVAEQVKAKIEEVSKPLTYDSQVISVFLEAASEIFEFYFKEKPKIGKPGVKPQGKPARGAITGLISFSSPGYVGSLALSVNIAYVKGLANAIFPEMQVTLDKTAAADIVGEMCNQVLGAVKTKFLKIGHNITLGLPEVIMGKNHTILHKVNNPVLFIPIGKDDMGCDVEFCLDVREIEIVEEEEDSSDVQHEGGTVLLF
jgi:CheY-like chemotaxis protein